MSSTDQIEFLGDVKISAGTDPSIYGDGNLDIANNLNVSGDTNITGNLSVTGSISSGTSGDYVIDGLNLGSGVGVFKTKNVNTLEFKSLIAGTNLNSIGNTNDITINLDDSINLNGTLGVSGNSTFYNNLNIIGNLSITGSIMSGISETFLNSATNLGSGEQVFKQITSDILEFRTLIAGTNLTNTQNTNDITIDLDPSISITGLTVLGNSQLNILGISGYIDFTPLSTKPSAVNGRLYYNETESALTFVPNTPLLDVELNIGQEFHIYIHNSTGNTITNGQLCHFNGIIHNSHNTIELAIASDENRAIVSGVATHNITNNSHGFLTRCGLVRNLDTSNFTSGDILYLSESVTGAFTNVKPEEGYQISIIGTIAKVGTTDGSIYVDIENNGTITNNSLISDVLGTIWASGLEITEHISGVTQAVDYTSGFYYINGFKKTIASGTHNLATEYGTLSSGEKAIVRIYADSDAVIKSTVGTPVPVANQATAPLDGANQVCLAEITITYGDTVSNNEIVDCRFSFGTGGTSSTDELVKISGNDTTAKFLKDSIVSGDTSVLTLTELNDGSNETLEIDIIQSGITHQNISGAGTYTHLQIDTHIDDVSNPHSVTIEQIVPGVTKGNLYAGTGIGVTGLLVGTNNYILSADSTTATGLQWLSPSTLVTLGITGNYALIRDVRSTGTNGGSMSGGTWHTRILNELTIPASFISLGTNTFTLSAGKYHIHCLVPTYGVNSNSRLFNITDSLVNQYGQSTRASGSVSMSHIINIFNIEYSTQYRIETFPTSNTTPRGSGYAVGISGVSEIYTMVFIYKL